MGEPPMNRAVLVFLMLLATAVQAAGQAKPKQSPAAGCEVVQDDGTRFVDTSVPYCGEYYASQHECSRTSVQRKKVCGNQDMFKAVNWDGIDMIINTHRGIWGLTLSEDAATRRAFEMSVGGPPENSFAGVQAAVHAGFRSVEFDIFLMQYPPNRYLGQTPVLNHFTDLRGFTNYSGDQVIPPTGVAGGLGFLMTEPWSRIPHNLLLRDRNAVVAADMPENRFVEVRDFLTSIKSQYPDLVVVLDLKWGRPLEQKQQKQRTSSGQRNVCIGFCNVCIGFCDYFTDDFKKAEVIQLIKSTISVADELGMLPNLIIKVPTFIPAQDAEAAFGNDFYRVLWAPQPDVTGRGTQEQVLKYIDDWQAIASGKPLSFWDTTIYAVTNWMGGEFTVGAKTYSDLMDYLRQTTGRRASIWTPDPAGPGGRHGNYAMSWNQVGNDPNDVRGDGLYNLAYSQSLNAIISSDRPDLFLQIRNQLLGPKPLSTSPERNR